MVDHYAKWTEARRKGINLRDWTTDGCHPNPAGHRELAKLIQPVLQRTIGASLKTRANLLAGESVRVVCFGDSVTGVYYHTGSRRAYTDMLGIALRRANLNANVEMINAGISGHTTKEALARIDRDVLSYKPDLVTIMFGLNDMTRVSIEQYRVNLKRIVAKCRANGSEVVLATPNNIVSTEQRPSSRLIKYCDVVREVGRELDVPVSDCYRELQATRSDNEFRWRLLMSDEIHPNMDGHQRIATTLAQTITGLRIPLDDVGPFAPSLLHVGRLLKVAKPIRVLAMSPYDKMVESAIRSAFPKAQVTVTPWPIADRSLAEIEQDAKKLVRAMKPDLVVIAVPRSASKNTDAEFARQYAWIMNWSLGFRQPTWDCVVIHPSVHEPLTSMTRHDELVRKLVEAQDLSLADRSMKNQATAESILIEWFRQEMAD